ncbi:VCBS repeat-containing protein [Alkalihalobacillus sp. AL-G]|uniref:VCBS repeat-containing protein n=1 Tax=Alkalihalobacillus sp. AL-G TaxID=2926399 RepID=UPI002729AEB7|nr:VCBS repeat-containing protein [Alkalihalobacillus sp. AL-G]WLD91737.1 VCBS repeat-containing protein [Alkalihalobacillus sp. AL-G]
MSNQMYERAVLDMKRGDVNGDRIQDTIYLTGSKAFPDSPFYEKITLWVHDGRTGKRTEIPLKTNMGYHPTLFLGDFTKDRVDDILIRMDSGGSGGMSYDYIYSFLNNQPNKLFDYEVFNNQDSYEVTYLDGYKARVKNKNSGDSFIIDLQYKGKEYLSEIYDQNGKLKQPISGWVNPLGEVYPVDFQRDGTYELLTYQRIAGRYNADGIGLLNTYLEWKNGKFAPYNQTVSIFG